MSNKAKIELLSRRELVKGMWGSEFQRSGKRFKGVCDELEFEGEMPEMPKEKKA